MTLYFLRLILENLKLFLSESFAFCSCVFSMLESALLLGVRALLSALGFKSTPCGFKG